MSQTSTSSSSPRSRALHLLALWGFAVAQPLLDLLGRFSEFLLVHRLSAGELILFMAVLLLLGPALLWLIGTLVGLVGRALGWAVHTSFVGILIASIALQFVRRIDALSGVVVLGSAVLLGAAATLAYVRFDAARRYLSVLALAVPVFAGVFLTRGEVARMAFRGGQDTEYPLGHGRPIPVFFVVFDELPLYALLDESHGIDADRYPNFAALAAQSNWYRHVSAVTNQTLLAVPAILSGTQHEGGSLPRLADHPQNLFTMLGGSHRAVVQEPYTSLCPPELDPAGRPSGWERTQALVSDLRVVYAHLTLPSDMSWKLPPITQGWKNFAAGAGKLAGSSVGKHGHTARRERFEEYLDRVEASDAPTLYFIHSLLPHNPFVYLPSGDAFTSSLVPPNGQAGQWGDWEDDPWAVAQNEQRFLLQLECVDMLLGRLMDKAKQFGLFDRSLFVVVADHGCSFRAGDAYRKITPTNVSDILTVPLFIKQPHQRVTRIIDRAVETVDILPTVAELLGAELPEPLDGHSLLDEARPEPSVRHAFETRRLNIHGSLLPALFARANEKIARFGTGKTPQGLFRLGQFGALVGQPLAGLEIRPDLQLRARLREPELFEDVQPGSGFVPSEITGFLQSSVENEGAPVQLAIAVNGVVQAVTQPFVNFEERPQSAWCAMVSPECFRRGRNEVEVLVVKPSPAGIVLDRPLPLGDELSFLGVQLGGRRIFGVEDEGFYRSNLLDGTMARWTKGNARLDIPLGASERPRRLRIALIRSSPEGSHLRVRVDGRTLFDEALPPGAWEHDIALDDFDFGERVRVELQSSTHIPAESDPDVNDRVLRGVAVEGIWLLP